MTPVAKVRTTKLECDLCVAEGNEEQARRRKALAYIVGGDSGRRTIELCREHAQPIEYMISLKPLNRYPIVTSSQAKAKKT